MTRGVVSRRSPASHARRAGSDPQARRWRRPRLPFPPIVLGFLLAGAALTTVTAWLLASQLHASALLAYVTGVNLTTFGAYLYDKSVAGSGAPLWRVPEAVLHLLALAGGTPAAFAGQHVLRHKTQKAGFRTCFWVIVAVQVAALVGWVWGSAGEA